MAYTQFIAQLLAAAQAQWEMLFQQQQALADRTLAWLLKEHYDQTIDVDPAQAAQAAALVTTLADLLNDQTVTALATWLNGMVAMDQGQFEQAHIQLTSAREQFLACNQPHHAAATQISNFRVLAMLGRDEEALQWGEWSLTQFTAVGDQLATGKVLLNLGILHFFRDRYVDAEALFRQAHTQFAAIDDQNQLLSVENNLATVLTAQYKFDEVSTLYERALARAETGHYEEAVAILQRNLGCLALFQGHFDQALDYLERSRRRYATLNIPHESAIADQEVADAYLELNLVPEAAAIYAQVTPVFAELGMRAEQARAMAYHGCALLRQHQVDRARTLLTEAKALYRLLGNAVGEATVLISLAEAALLEGDFHTASTLAEQTEAAFTTVNAWGRLLQARWLRGEALYRAGQITDARPLLEQTLQDARTYLTLPILHRALTSLGLLAVSVGDIAQAETYFKEAVALIEQMRAPLPAESFRIAFLGDKLTPYTELVRICLTDGSPARVAEALGYVERARARSLLDLLGDVHPTAQSTADPIVAEIEQRIEHLREELNWFYSQINRPDSPIALRGAVALADLQTQTQARERLMLDLLRQLQQYVGLSRSSDPTFTPEQLYTQLGTETVLIEYFSLDGDLLAFVVTDQTLAVVDLQCREETIEAILQHVHFQLGTLRYGRERMAQHQGILVERIQHYLAQLYTHLLEPVEAHWGSRRLLIAPHRTLHYVPFHALYDGVQYVVEQREVCYTPSAAILQYCLTIPKRPAQHTLLLGTPDEAAPRIADEIAALQVLFPQAQVLLDEQATRQALMRAAPLADLIHLACHGRFRADNPLFSALQLHDGWLTVNDAAQLNLQCNLVTLSACETGINAAAPGDELLGLARGFLLAGTPALLMSLWAVDDHATAEFMQHFYTHLQAGVGAAAALRQAQCQLLATQPHPFFWAPFILFGRWT